MRRATVLDTDVLIDHLRGWAPAIAYIEGQKDEELAVSAVSVSELFVGSRSEEEAETLDRFLGAFRILPVSYEIARLAGQFRRGFGQSHGTSLPDAIIAASARIADARLMTFNLRHFPMLGEVSVPYPRRETSSRSVAIAEAKDPKSHSSY